MHQASGRLPSTAMSNTMSGSMPERLHQGRARLAPSTSSPRISSPASSSDIPSSLPEHSIPLDHTPLIFWRPIAKPPGRMAPTGASGTRSPTAKFVAPQTISSWLRAGIDHHPPDPVGPLDGG